MPYEERYITKRQNFKILKKMVVKELNKNYFHYYYGVSVISILGCIKIFDTMNKSVRLTSSFRNSFLKGD
jgi:hypothetical protein